MKAVRRMVETGTRGLTSESGDPACEENQQRYDSALAAAISERDDPIAAERIAISVLGDADTANFRYRRALLTAMEASILRQGARERAVASASCVLASALLVIGWALLGRQVLAVGLGAKLPGENVAIWRRMF